jgi:hypothetical protein
VNLRRTLPAAVTAVLLVIAALALALVPASSGAFVIGVGDHNPALFSNPQFTALHPKRVRYILPYDSALKPKQRRDTDAWMRAARSARKEIVVAFNPPLSMKCPNLNGKKGCRPVSRAAFTKGFKAFRKRYPYVKIIQPWNEVNNLTQPTVYRPDAVVTYYDVVRRNCRGCTILGADIQDLPNMVPYTRALLENFRKRHVRTPRLWGFHNYTDINRFVSDRNSSMRKLLRLVPGKLWLTETGGLYRFAPQNARQTFRPDLKRQKRAMDALFKQAVRYRSRIDRVYVYHWFGAPRTNRWDSGVLDAAGKPRPAYSVLARYKRYFK